MALYEYKCTNKECSEEFEVRISIKEVETKVVQCPKCNSVAERLISRQKAIHSTWRNWRL